MSDPTKNLDGKKPFEDRVFARFDAIEEYLRNLDSRVQMLESRSYNTKPIWERALQEIIETRQELKDTRDEVKDISVEVREIRVAVKELRVEVNETRDELKYFQRVVTDRLDQIQSAVLETRVDVRRAHDRIDKTESSPS